MDGEPTMDIPEIKLPRLVTMRCSCGCERIVPASWTTLFCPDCGAELELAGFVRASGISGVSLRLMLLRYDVILHEEDIPPDLRGPENRKTKRRQMRI